MPKDAPPDGKTLFPSVDECEANCRIIPAGMSFGCAGSRPAGCVLLDHPSNIPEHYFPGIEQCNDWCSPPPSKNVTAP